MDTEDYRRADDWREHHADRIADEIARMKREVDTAPDAFPSVALGKRCAICACWIPDQAGRILCDECRIQTPTMKKQGA